jgi:orotidine-5'-phosphate decarboxylase
MKSHERIIFALDGMDTMQATAWARKLQGKIGLVKVGLELFVRGGPNLVKTLVREGMQVMLDLKMNDIPVTMRNTTRAAAELGVRFITAHAGAGREALKACTEVTKGTDMKVVAVTLLTSLDDVDAARVFRGRGVFLDHSADTRERRKALRVYASGAAENVVQSLAYEAVQGDVTYFVCSPEEASTLKDVAELSTVITPGIRLGGGDTHDQKRVKTPEGAIANGADYLVIGRAIRDAESPEETISVICDQICRGLIKAA